VTDLGNGFTLPDLRIPSMIALARIKYTQGKHYNGLEFSFLFGLGSVVNIRLGFYQVVLILPFFDTRCTASDSGDGKISAFKSFQGDKTIVPIEILFTEIICA